MRHLRDRYEMFSSASKDRNRPVSMRGRTNSPQRRSLHSTAKKKKHVSRSIVLDDMMRSSRKTSRELFFDDEEEMEEESGPPPPSLDATDTIVKRLEARARQTMVEMRKRLVTRCQRNEKRERDRCRSAMRVCLGELRSSRRKAKELEQDLVASRDEHQDLLRQEREMRERELERAKREAERAVKRARDDALRTVMAERKRARDTSRAVKEKYEEATRSKLREYREHLQVAMRTAAEQVESLRYELDDATEAADSQNYLRLTDTPWKDRQVDEDVKDEDDRSVSYIHRADNNTTTEIDATPASRAALRLYRHISAAETYNGDFS